MINRFKIFELADRLYDGVSLLTWRTRGAYPFAMHFDNDIVDRWWNGRESSMHDHYFYANIFGRVWTKEKIISFWEYPKEENIKSILDYIQLQLNYSKRTFANIDFTSGWRIEIRLSEHDADGYIQRELIPIEEYLGSEDDTDSPEYLHHLNLKKNRKVKGGFGSKKGLKYKLPGESEIQAKRRLKYMYQEKNN